MTIASGMGKMPGVYLIHEANPNAFAVGRKPDTCAVAVTSSLLRILNRDELQGVIGHEIGHLKNRDTTFMVLAADKTEPGAFNLPLYLAFADPMYSPGLLLSEALHEGFTFHIMDVDYTEGDRVIVLEAPERLYDIAALLRDTHRYAIESIWSRKYPNEQAAAVATSRLRNIAGRYVGKDDPVTIVRVQKIFPATEEFGPTFALGAFVAGDTRGSHNLPLMPVPINTPASTFFCCPMVSALGFSMREGILTEPSDLFSDPFWHHVRDRVAAKAIDMRRQGFFEPATLPYSELEYGGIVLRLRRLEEQFTVRDGQASAAPVGAPAGVESDDDPD
jgi:fructose 1,6-bisphosphate aldolase/phosphatase